MENESKGSCIAMVFAIVGFLANIINLISLVEFIMSLRKGGIGTGPVTTLFLPFPLEQVDYALIAGTLLFYGTVATGVFLWFLSANQIHSSQISKLRSWLAPQTLAVIFFTRIYWLAFKDLFKSLFEDFESSMSLLIIIFLFFLSLPGIVSYYLYEGWSHPRRRK